MTIGRLSLRVTPFGKGFIAMTFLVGLAAINTGNNLLYLILAAMCSLIVVSGILSEQTIWRLSVTRRLPPHLFASEPFAMEVTVTNRKRWLPSFCVTVGLGGGMRGASFLVLGPRETQTRAVTHCVSRRGPYTFNGYDVTTSFPFGLFLKTIAHRDPLEALVYPRLRPLREILNVSQPILQPEHEVNRRGAGASLYNLRDYQDGDEARAIHWKTSARQARLMVKEQAREEERRTTIVVSQAMPGPRDATADARGLEVFEACIELAASLSEDFLAKGYGVRLLTLDRAMGYGTGRNHLYRILRELALLQPSPSKGEGAGEGAGWGEARRLLPRPGESGSILIRCADDPLWTGRDSAFAQVFTR